MLKTETAGSKQITIVYVIVTFKVRLNNLILIKVFLRGRGVGDLMALCLRFFFPRFSKGRHSVMLTRIVDVHSSNGNFDVSAVLH